MTQTDFPYVEREEHRLAGVRRREQRQRFLRPDREALQWRGNPRSDAGYFY